MNVNEPVDPAHLGGARAANLAAKFLLELAALAALAYWGAGTGTGSGWVRVVLVVAAPLLMCVLWGLFAAPRARRRLDMRWRVPFELLVFAVAAVALAAAGAVILAILFAAAVGINAVLLTRFRQWEG